MICDLTTGAKRMQKATKLLKEKWADTREHWNDHTAQQYEEKFLRPLGEKIQLALAAVNRFSEVMQRAEKELQDEKKLS